MPHTRTLPALLVCLICAFRAGASGADLKEYAIDLQGPARLAFERPQQIPTPTRAVVYVTGPKMDHDKRPLAALLGSPPAYATTNYTDITNLIAALCGERDNTARVTNSTRHNGYTYHVLLFQDSDKAVMQFRVLEFTDVKTEWYDVWPRSDTGFGYFNRPIGPWLHEHVKIPTNTAPAAR